MSQFSTQINPIVPSTVAPLHALYTPADQLCYQSSLASPRCCPNAISGDRRPSSTTSLEQITASSWRAALPLCSYVPCAVDWRVALDRIPFVGSSAEDLILAEVGRVLNGVLVGLVSSWEDDANTTCDVVITDSGDRYPQELSSSPSTGPGASETESSEAKMHVLTPPRALPRIRQGRDGVACLG